MTKTCIVKGCKSFWYPGQTLVSFFCVPFQNEELLKKWVSTGIKLKNVSKTSRICSNHFDSKDYLTTHAGKRILNKGALPKLDHSTCVLLADDIEVDDTIDVVDDTEETTEENSTSLVQVDKTNEEPKKKEMCTVAVQTEHRLVGRTDYEKKLLRRIKLLQNRLCKRKKNISNVRDLVNHLKGASHCTNNLEEVLLTKFSKFDLALFLNEKRNNSIAKNRKQYTGEMKNFASALYFYSPQAYEFVRTKINLPHSATLRKWKNDCKIEKGCES